MSTLDDLLGAALGAVPRLPGARCRSRSHLWDEYDDPEVIEYCLSQCRRCPALAGCTAWFDSLPARRRPHGTVAGQLNRPKQPKHSKGSHNER